MAGMNPILFRLAAVWLTGAALLTRCPSARALDRTNEVFKIFQFPADQIPRIDGDTNDWKLVPESYVIGTDQLVDDNGQHQVTDASTPKIRVRVGWVNGAEPVVFSI